MTEDKIKCTLIVKPYNHQGNLELLTENINIEDFYVKKQIYEFIFSDIDLYMSSNPSETVKRKHYKLKPNKPFVNTYEIQTEDGPVAINIDYSILH